MRFLKQKSVVSCSLFLLFVSAAFTYNIAPELAIAASTTPSLTPLSGNVTRSVLLALKASISSDPTGALVSWNTSSHFCTWEGVLCSNNSQVKSLRLNSLSLSGTLPPQIADLQGLSYLDVSYNSFHGPMPMRLGALAQTLTHLDLSANKFTGNLPPSLASCTLLQFIDLSSNSLSGQFPSYISNFTALGYMDVSSNDLAGELPQDMGLLSELQHFQVFNNHITGTIPPSLLNCSELVWLNLAQNGLSGPLPASDTTILASLQQLIITDNNLTGSMPPSLEYASGLRISTKADVYSYGVLLLELVTGVRPTSSKLQEEGVSLSNWARTLHESGRTREALDSKLNNQDTFHEAEGLLRVGLMCSMKKAKDRPSMQVVRESLMYLKGQRLVKIGFEKTIPSIEELLKAPDHPLVFPDTSKLLELNPDI